MLTASRNMTLFNLVLDSTTRREILIPTNIAGVAFYEIDSSKAMSGVRSENITCKIRIPIDATFQAGRSYISESQYKSLTEEERAGYWTLQKGAYVLLATDTLPDWTADDYTLTSRLSKEKVTALTGRALYSGPLITVLEYADNTLRGSQAVKHWRIGGQ